MTDVITEWQDVGVCEIDVEKVVAQWNDNCGISQSDEIYKLFEHSDEADNFTKTSFKVEISESQAQEITKRLGLVYTPSPVFRNAGVWRETYGER